MKIHLKNFDIPSSVSPNPIEGGSVIIQDGVIEEIIADPSVENEIDGDKTINGRGNLLLPGFFNAHTHMGMTIFRGYADDIELESWLQDWIWPAEENLTEEEVYWGSLLALIESIRSGVTALADMYFYMDETARAIKESGVRGLISYGLIADELDEKGEKELKTALDLVEKWDGEASNRLKVALSPHAPYTCGNDVLKEVSSISGQKNIPIHTHISETKKEVEDSYEEFGCSPVERLADLGVLENEVLAAHCVHLDESDIELLAQNDVVVAHNPTSNMKISSGAAPVQGLSNRGIQIALGTDGPGTNNDLDMFGEMRQASFLAKLNSNDPTALSAEKTLAMATGKGMDKFDVSGPGVIAEGKRADLIGLKRDSAAHWTPEYRTTSNLVYSGKSSDVEMVMVDGKMVMVDGKIKTVDEGKVLDKVQEISQKYDKIRKNHK